MSTINWRFSANQAQLHYYYTKFYSHQKWTENGNFHCTLTVRKYIQYVRTYVMIHSTVLLSLLCVFIPEELNFMGSLGGENPISISDTVGNSVTVYTCVLCRKSEGTVTLDNGRALRWQTMHVDSYSKDCSIHLASVVQAVRSLTPLQQGVKCMQ